MVVSGLKVRGGVAGRVGRHRAGRGGRVYFEVLEGREMLAGDYTLAFTSLTAPSGVVEGFKGVGSAKLLLTNVSNAGFLAGDKGDIRVVARPVGAVDASDDVELGKMLNQAVGMKVTGTKSFTLPLTVPAGTAAGDYLILATATRVAGQGGAEMANVTAGAGFTVEAQRLDVKAELLSVTAPDAATSGGTAKGTAKVRLTNVGNIPIPLDSDPGALVELVRDSDQKSETLDGNSIHFQGAKPGASVTVSFSFAFDDRFVESGVYHFRTYGAADPEGDDADPSNNTSTLAGKTVTITQGVIDLSAAIKPGVFPTSVIVGVTPAATFTVNLTNSGTIVTPVGEDATIRLVARPKAGGNDVALGSSLFNQDIGKLGVGKGKSYVFKNVNLGGLAVGEYDIVGIVSDQTQEHDLDLSNNEGVAGHSVTVALPVVDLQALGAVSTVSGDVAGLKKGVYTVSVKNLGNVPAVGYKVEVFATVDGTITPSSIAVGTLAVAGKILAGATAKAAVQVTAPGPTVGKSYVLTARVTTTTQEDVQHGNDVLVGGTINVAAVAQENILGLIPTTMTFTQVGGVTFDGFGDSTTGTAQGVGNNVLTSDYFNGRRISGGAGKATLSLLFFGFQFEGISLTYYSGSALQSLDGRTIVFSKSAVGAAGTFTVGAVGAWGLEKAVAGFFRFV